MATVEKVDNEISFVKKIEKCDNVTGDLSTDHSTNDGVFLNGDLHMDKNGETEEVNENALEENGVSIIAVTHGAKSEIIKTPHESSSDCDDANNIISKMEKPKEATPTISSPKPAKKTILDYLEKATKLFKKKTTPEGEGKKEINEPTEPRNNQENGLDMVKAIPQTYKIADNNNMSSDIIKSGTHGGISSKPKVPKARKSANPNSKTTELNLEATVKSIHLGPLANVTLHVPEIGKVLGANRLQKLGLTRSTPPKDINAKEEVQQESSMATGDAGLTVTGADISEHSETTKKEECVALGNIKESTENITKARIGGRDIPKSKKRKSKPFRGGRYHLGIRPKTKHAKKDSPGRVGGKRAKNTNKSLKNTASTDNETDLNDSQSSELGNILDESKHSFNLSRVPTGANYDTNDRIVETVKKQDRDNISKTENIGSETNQSVKEGTNIEAEANIEVNLNENEMETEETIKEAAMISEEVTDDLDKAMIIIKKVRRRKSSWSKGNISKPKPKKKMTLEARVAKLKNQSHNIIRHKIQLAAIDSKPPDRVKLEDDESPQIAADDSDSGSSRRSQRKRKAPEDDFVTIDIPEHHLSPCGKAHMSPLGYTRVKFKGTKRRKAEDLMIDDSGTLSMTAEAPVLSPIKPVQASSLTGTQSSPSSATQASPTKPIQELTGSPKKEPLPIGSAKMKGSSYAYTHPLISNSEQLRAQVATGFLGPAIGSTAQQNIQPAVPCEVPVKVETSKDTEGGDVQDHGYMNTPDGLTYPVPVTPPRTPDDHQLVHGERQDVSEAASLPPEKDFIPLCCCKISSSQPVDTSIPKVLYCQALDSIDGKVMGCCNKVSNQKLVRPAIKIPFLSVCEVHRQRLRLHQCCPGCGHFCTQGSFYQCKKEGSSIHHFHKNCQVFKDNKYYCPHCGEESSQFEVFLKLNEPKAMQSFVKTDIDANKGPKAKMTFRTVSRGTSREGSEENVPAVTAVIRGTPISSAKLPVGPARNQLEAILEMLNTESGIKKMRTGPKNLYAPSLSGELERVVFQLSEGSDPNHHFEEQNNETALHAAAFHGHLAIVHCLVQAGAMPNALDGELKTPLMCAADMNKLDVIDYLLKCGAELQLRAEDGMTALHLAAKSGHLDVVKYILNTGKVTINSTDDGGWTSLVWAAEYQHVETVKFLLDIGADPNLKDQEGNTALHWAAFSGAVNVAELFLNAGCDIESANEHGDRPLHIAARQDHYNCVVLFLARGADSEGRNNTSQAPISCCVDQTTQVWLALRVNKQLKGFAAKQLMKPERLLHRDISMGKESVPVPVVNGVDDENYPDDFLYVADNIETTPLNVNRVLTSLQHCRCRDNCASVFCVCGRNSVQSWYDKEGRLVKEFNQQEPPLLFECNKACLCWTTCQNRVVQHGVTCRLQVFRTKGRGWGLRTLLNIKQGTFVCEYVGEHISDAEADSREDDSYLFDLDNKDGDTFCIDARKYANLSRFINHLCEPNLVTVKVFTEHQDLRFPKICFFASRDIKANEELGFDYGEKFWIIKWKQFTCECCSPKCRYSKDTIHKTIEEYNKRIEEEDDDSLV